MKTVLKLLTLLVFFTLFSCKYGVEMRLINCSNKTLNQVLITNGFKTNQLGDIQKDTIIKTFLDFKENNSGIDGNFKIDFSIDGKIKSYKFGYYSNGIPSVKDYEIKIFKDTILIKNNF
ncbi:hypothetical protein EZY14_011185 [Kordia sp. TARA_039_SRF]|nr:hypothetical protein EZY14_011185 [Kordia sp. TARA_039_SRF]